MGWYFGNGWNNESCLIYLVMLSLLDYEENIGEYNIKKTKTKEHALQ